MQNFVCMYLYVTPGWAGRVARVCLYTKLVGERASFITGMIYELEFKLGLWG